MTPEELIEKQHKLLLAFDQWPLKDEFMDYIKRQGEWGRTPFDVAFSDPRFASNVSHGAAIISGRQDIVNLIEEDTEQAIQWKTGQPQPQRRKPRKR